MKKKQTSKKTIIRLSPKDAEKVIQTEFVDNKGGRHGFNVIFKPHLPNTGDMQLDYNTEKGTK